MTYGRFRILHRLEAVVLFAAILFAAVTMLSVWVSPQTLAQEEEGARGEQRANITTSGSTVTSGSTFRISATAEHHTDWAWSGGGSFNPPNGGAADTDASTTWTAPTVTSSTAYTLTLTAAYGDESGSISIHRDTIYMRVNPPPPPDTPEPDPPTPTPTPTPTSEPEPPPDPEPEPPPLSAPATPGRVTVTRPSTDGPSSVRVSWRAVADVERYRVQRSTSRTRNYSTVGTITRDGNGNLATSDTFSAPAALEPIISAWRPMAMERTQRHDGVHIRRGRPRRPARPSPQTSLSHGQDSPIPPSS